MKTYKELQSELQNYKSSGLTNVALNSTRETLENELHRLTLDDKLKYDYEVLEYDCANQGITSLDSPSNYIGSGYDGFLTLTQSYPHDLINEFNYEYFINWLKDNKIDYELVNFGHWAVGNYTRIGIPISNDLNDIIAVDEKCSELHHYPIFDDCKYSQYEWDKFQEYFDESFGGFHEVCETFYEFLECDKFDCEFDCDYILETWLEFVNVASWEYYVECADFVLNLRDYKDFLYDNYSHLLDPCKSELYFARNNPNQLSIPNLV